MNHVVSRNSSTTRRAVSNSGTWESNCIIDGSSIRSGSDIPAAPPVRLTK